MTDDRTGSQGDAGSAKSGLSTSFVLRDRLKSLHRMPSIHALFDQGIVSGTRFVTSVLIGRFCGPEDLGYYTIAFALLLLAMAVQESLISKPYTVFSARRDRERNSVYEGNVFMQHGALVLLAMTTCLLSAVFLRLSYAGDTRLPLVLLLLTAILPFTLLWDLLRRLFFARFKMIDAVFLDTALAFLQLGLLVGLAYIGTLSLTTAMLCIAGSSALVSLAWLFVWLRSFPATLRFSPPDWSQNWRFGNWILAGQVLGTLHGYAVPWVLTFAANIASTGVFVAAQSVVLLANPMMLGIGNWLGPRASHAMVEGGKQQVRKLILQVSGLVLAAMGLLAGIMYLFGAMALEFLFGPAYADQQLLVSVLGLCPIFWSLTVVLGTGLTVLERTKTVFWGSVLGVVLTLLLVVPLTWTGGIVGGAIALLLGSAAGTLHLLWYFNSETFHPHTEVVQA